MSDHADPVRCAAGDRATPSAEPTPFEPQGGWLTHIEKGGEPAGERREEE